MLGVAVLPKSETTQTTPLDIDPTRFPLLAQADHALLNGRYYQRGRLAKWTDDWARQRQYDFVPGTVGNHLNVPAENAWDDISGNGFDLRIGTANDPAPTLHIDASPAFGLSPNAAYWHSRHLADNELEHVTAEMRQWQREHMP